MANSEDKGIITDGANFDKIAEIWAKLPYLKTVIVTKGRSEDKVTDFWEAIEKPSSEFTPVKTRADDSALIIYTSGTTGPPKGALPAHRVVLGHLPGVEFPHNFFPRSKSIRLPHAKYWERGGETLGEEPLGWGKETMGLMINKFYGRK